MMVAQTGLMAVKATRSRQILGVLSWCGQCAWLDLSCEEGQRQGFWSEKLERWSYHYLRMKKTLEVWFGKDSWEFSFMRVKFEVSF